MLTRKGIVASVIYRNPDTLYTVFELHDSEEQLTCVGYPSAISEGETVEVTGEMTEHPLYGEQLKAESVRLLEPEGIQAIYRYLASGAIKGIGSSLARKIVDRFGTDTMAIMKEEPERLSEIKGISDQKARKIASQLNQQKEQSDALIFLGKYGVGGRKALKIYERYGENIYNVLKENPYCLVEEVNGFGFPSADAIAEKEGIPKDSPVRIRSGILYVLSRSLEEGNSYLPESVLVAYVQQFLDFPKENADIFSTTIQSQLMELASEGKIKILVKQDAPQVYSIAAYHVEQDCAKRLLALEASSDSYWSKDEIEERMQRAEEESGIILEEEQKEAVFLALSQRVLLISGNPGTGKTTIINTIIRIFSMDAFQIELAAPTGRAARRVSQAAGCEAVTIHRLLDYHAVNENDGPGQNKEEEGWHFEKNEDNPLTADVVIIDEMSMVDLYLFDALLKAIPFGTRLIMVGDSNQLPSVGPGRVFGDLLDSGQFPSLVLHKIFRQAQKSDIVMNAHRILLGETLKLDNHSKDFFFLERGDVQVIYKHTVELMRDMLPSYVGGKQEDVQVLTPMRKGSLGSIRLNEVLQSVLNPKDFGKTEVKAHGVTFRVGDKVMQIRNDYQLEWEIQEESGFSSLKGCGIFNGDAGVIVDIDSSVQELTVRFDEGKLVQYPFSSLEELDLAYAITVHKSQGSEYLAVILPLLSGPKTLMTKNLLYTAITRARSCVVILGSKETVQEMEENEEANLRYTGLSDRIQEMKAMDAGEYEEMN